MQMKMIYIFGNQLAIFLKTHAKIQKFQNKYEILGLFSGLLEKEKRFSMFFGKLLTASNCMIIVKT